MFEAKSEHTKLAMKAIDYVVNGKDLQKLKLIEGYDDALKENLSCFVSIHLDDGSLRGCIGTIQPKEENLYLEIISNAVAAATHDTRFTKIKPEELGGLEISVDVLSKPWLVKSIDELDPKKLGVIVSDGNYSRGVLLPDIEGVDTVEHQISIAKRKAGLANFETSALKVYAFTSTRYY